MTFSVFRKWRTFRVCLNHYNLLIIFKRFVSITCGGKTSLALKLLKKFAGSVHISQDDFFREEHDPNHEWINVSSSIRHQNWESLASVDWLEFYKYIQYYLNKEPENDNSFIIIEGHIIFDYKPIHDICETKFFVTLTKEQCLERRSSRDYIPADPDGYFDFVWSMYATYESNLRAYSDIVFIDGSLDRQIIFDEILKYI